MGIHLVVDGYNLIRQSPFLSGVESRDFQKGREALLESLSAYKSARGHRITVVFDGWKGGNGSETADHIKGIRVIYSRQGETADEVIKRIIEKEGEKAVIVTSDMEIVSFARRKKAAVVFSQVFESKMIQAISCPDGDDEDEEFIPFLRKGEAKRRPRRERHASLKLKKL